MKLCKNPKIDYKVLIDSDGNFHYKDGSINGKVIGVFWLNKVGYVNVSDVYKNGKSLCDETINLYEET